MSEGEDEVKSKIRSLADARKKREHSVRKSYLTAEQRIAELEEDLVRVIDSLADQDYIIHNQARTIRLLVRAVSHLASRIPDPTPKPS
jgi:hypothetical protein